MKKHLIIKELGEGICRVKCQLLVMRYDGTKDKGCVTCNRCKKQNAS